MQPTKMKMLIVDDTILFRKIIKDILETFPFIEVVGSVNSGATALSRIKSSRPDLLTLDVEMPGMNGLQVLAEIQKQRLPVECVMVSSKTQKDSLTTIKALELGAFDFVSKPDETTMEGNIAAIKKDLAPILRAFDQRLKIKRKLKTPLGSSVKSAALRGSTLQKVSSRSTTTRPRERTEKSSIVAIGISTGGPKALAQVLPKLPADLGVPILLVQHMPPVFTASLAENLNKKCQLTVKQAVNGERIEPNTVYIAEGGKQMKIAAGSGQHKIIRITDDPPENNCRPSVDYLFRSVAREFGSKSTCVVMTGMGADGKLGAAVTHAAGAFNITQDAESSVVYGMPKAVYEAGFSHIAIPLRQITDSIIKSVR